MKVLQVQKPEEKLATMAKTLKAIANPIRLRIVQLLVERDEMTVNEICEKLANCEQSLLSHHLAALKDAELLSSRREGRRIYYYSTKTELEALLRSIERCCI